MTNGSMEETADSASLLGLEITLELPLGVTLLHPASDTRRATDSRITTVFFI